MPERRGLSKRAISSGIFLLAAGVYANSLRGGFVYDDHPIVVENPLVRGDATLGAVFSSSYWQRGAPRADRQAPHGGLYRPLTILSFALNRRLTGFNPFPFHLLNVLLHGAASVILFWLICALGFPVAAAAAGALSFAVLPVHAEAVSWIVGRAELLGTVFALAAWLLFHRQRSRTGIAAALGCYALALLSKESAAPLVGALVLGEIFASRASLKDLADKRLPAWLAAFGVLIAYLAWRRSILGAVFPSEAPYFTVQGPLIRALTMSKFLFRAWLWPLVTGTGLCADYARPGFADATTHDVLAWAALTATAGLAAWAVRDFAARRSGWAFSVLIFFCLAAPLSNLFVQMAIIGAERIMYLPSIALALLISSAWRSLGGKTSRSFALAAACLVLWAALTFRRNEVWRSDQALFAATAECSPENPRVLIGLGMTADQAGRHSEARELYKKAFRSEPAHALYNIGKSFYDEGDWRDSKLSFAELARLGPPDADALCFMGLIAEKEGSPRAAASYYDRALERDPTHPEARRDLGLLLFKTGSVAKAIEQLELYLKEAPSAEDAADIDLFIKRVAPPRPPSRAR